MDEFVKCSNCGAEITTGGGKCPVCGADNQACTSDEASGSVRGAARPSPKKSAFAPSPAGAYAGTAPFDSEERPRSGFGCFGLIMFGIGFAVSFFGSTIFAFTAADRIYSHKIAQPIFSYAPTFFSMAAFIMASGFAGAALFYNFSVLVSSAEEYSGGKRNFIRAWTFPFYYLASFAIALPLGFFALLTTHGRFFMALICLNLFLIFSACLRITLTDLWPGEKTLK